MVYTSGDSRKILIRANRPRSGAAGAARLLLAAVNRANPRWSTGKLPRCCALMFAPAASIATVMTNAPLAPSRNPTAAAAVEDAPPLAAQTCSLSRRGSVKNKRLYQYITLFLPAGSTGVRPGGKSARGGGGGDDLC